MKKYIVVVSAFLAIGCGQSKDIQSSQEIDRKDLIESATLFSKTDLPYQKFAPAVKFFTPAEMPGKTMYQLVDEQKQFISNANLPTAENMAVWTANHSLNDAIAGYKLFKQQNKDHKYLRSFRQYSSWMILTKLNLLSTNSINDIAYFTNELVEANYNGFGLLNYLLRLLNENRFDKEQIAEWAITITNSPDAKTSTQPFDASTIQLNGVADFHAAKTKKDIIDFLEKKHKEHTEDLESIRKYISKK